MLWLKRLALAALAFVLLAVASYGLALGIYFNLPGAYDSDQEFPLFLLGWFGAALFLIAGVALSVLYRFRSRLW